MEFVSVTELTTICAVPEDPFEAVVLVTEVVTEVGETDTEVLGISIGCVCPGISDVESPIKLNPPVAPTEYSAPTTEGLSPPAPTINLSLKSGVPLVPLQITHPEGIDAIDPDHIIIPPIGIVPNPLSLAEGPATISPTEVILAPALTFPVNVEVPLTVRLLAKVEIPVTLMLLENVVTPVIATLLLI